MIVMTKEGRLIKYFVRDDESTDYAVVGSEEFANALRHEYWRKGKVMPEVGTYEVPEEYEHEEITPWKI